MKGKICFRKENENGNEQHSEEKIRSMKPRTSSTIRKERPE